MWVLHVQFYARKLMEIDMDGAMSVNALYVNANAKRHTRWRTSPALALNWLGRKGMGKEFICEFLKQGKRLKKNKLNNFLEAFSQMQQEQQQVQWKHCRI